MAVQPRPAPAAPRRARPTLQELTRAGLWLGVYVGVAFWPLLFLLAAPAPYGGLSAELGSMLGYLAISTMAMQFILTARFQWMTPPFGADLVYAFHRYVTIVSVAFAIAHPLLVFGGDFASVAASAVPWAPPWAVGAGAASLWALVAIAVTSFWRKRLRLPYETWRRLHGALAVAAVLLGLWHAATSGRLMERPVVRWGWLVWTVLWVGLIVRVRVVKPLSLVRRPWVIREVVPQRGDLLRILVEPDGHEGFRFRSGQFAWLTVGSSPFVGAEHPFSIASSSQAAPRLEFVVKALGDFTRWLQDVKPGTRAWVDGPYGTMSIDTFPDADGYLFVAGGSGIAPCLSMLRTLADRRDGRRHVLVYGTYSWAYTPLTEEIAELASRLELEVVHVLQAPDPGWRGEVGLITQELLGRHLPAVTKTVAFVCGPPAMMDAVERSLVRLGIHYGDLHSERFDLV
ncbi:MAG TPA: ferric reductase-like transmembrane domain-containing protein [Anaeromyxobacteraceae bacterium]|nr:ferric reductase-like transmembrane domain-containing protein [Anaeromyxobacteraceae bacterium]